ncbi:MAG: glycoside hydrolase family 43 protein [Prevotella sp.]|nr:glycoside hydrolase family 43 protein [Prevotella sp.]
MRTKKRLTMLLVAVLPLMGAQAQETELTYAEAKTLYKSTSKKRVSVHDPSVVYDTISAAHRYYIIGSHRAMGYSTDMKNWTGSSEQFARVNDDGSTTTVGQSESDFRRVFSKHRTTTITKGGQEIAFGNYDATAWSRAVPDNSGDWNLNGNMWAPDMIWNPVMKKWCQYLSLNGQAWNSVIVLLTADKLTGLWVYEGPVVYSGFRSATDQRVSWKKTDLELVIGEQSTLPSRYNHPSYNNGDQWGDYWPNNIDPTVFYDEDGQLRIAYGSWSGGIWMLHLNEENGLRDYDVTYSSDYATRGKQCTSDPYFGKRIAGGCYVSGEAPYIEHIGDYYYLFMTYGGLAPDGGYEMRIFRSEKPDGPYKDPLGRSAQFTSWVLNYGVNADKRGEKILGSYNKWGYQTVGECAQGHNSVIAAPDGRTYLIYHTKFNNGTVGFQVRVHQLFVNQKGWLVAAPFEYNGEELTDSTMGQPAPFSKEDIAGTYDVMIHKYSMDHNNMEEVTPQQIVLRADGSVRGSYTGSWSIDEGTSYLTIRLGSTTYFGVIFEEEMDGKSMHTISFTGCSNTGVNLWGYKLHPKYALAQQLNTQKIPTYDYQTIRADIDLDGVWKGDPNVTVTWTSSHPTIIDEHGHFDNSSVQEETAVILTLRITSGTYFYQNEYSVKVKPDPTGIVDLENSVSTRGEYYDLKGRRVTKPQRGILIKDGRLIIIK